MNEGKVMTAKSIVASYAMTLISWLANAVDDNPVAYWIAFAISILASLGSVALTIVKFVSWLKGALKDGKITEDELKEGEKIIDELKGVNSDENESNPRKDGNS